MWNSKFKIKIWNSKSKFEMQNQNLKFNIQNSKFEICTHAQISKLKIRNSKFARTHSTNFEFRFVISDVLLQVSLLSTYARDEKVQCWTSRVSSFFLLCCKVLIFTVWFLPSRDDHYKLESVSQHYINRRFNKSLG